MKSLIHIHSGVAWATPRLNPTLTPTGPRRRVFLGDPARISPVSRLYLNRILDIPLYPCIDRYLAVLQQTHCIPLYATVLYPYVSRCIQLYLLYPAVSHRISPRRKRNTAKNTLQGRTPQGTPWPLQDIRFMSRLCTRINSIICKRPLCLGTPLTALHRRHCCAIYIPPTPLSCNICHPSINQSKILTEPHTGKEKPIPALPQGAANLYMPYHIGNGNIGRGKWLTLRQSGERLPESRCFVEETCRTEPVVPLFL